jgi:hypothetical protein
MPILRAAAHVGFTLVGGLLFAAPGALLLLGHTVQASTGSGTFGSWNLQGLVLLGGFCAGCALGFVGFRWLAGPRR